MNKWQEQHWKKEQTSLEVSKELTLLKFYKKHKQDACQTSMQLEEDNSIATLISLTLTFHLPINGYKRLDKISRTQQKDKNFWELSKELILQKSSIRQEENTCKAQHHQTQFKTSFKQLRTEGETLETTDRTIMDSTITINNLRAHDKSLEVRGI